MVTELAYGQGRMQKKHAVVANMNEKTKRAIELCVCVAQTCLSRGPCETKNNNAYR